MRKSFIAVLVGIATASVAACGPLDELPAPGAAATISADGAAPAAADDKLTPAQRNAVKKAKSYLDHSAFSRSGLVEQLEYEGFSNADAVFAVDYLKPNWTEQAKKKAKDYMQHSSFSQSGLAEQLEFEGFTPEEAKAGAASQF